MSRLGEDAFTVCAEAEGRLVGFVHTVLDADHTWGALVDNLHVTHGLKGSGIGTALMAVAARMVVERRPATDLYVWVLEQNEAVRGTRWVRVERRPAPAPGGAPRMGG